MNEKNSGLSYNTWSDVIGQVYKKNDVLGYEMVDERDLIVLNTADGTEICPTSQFIDTYESDSGKWSIATSRYVGLGWKIASLSGLSEWSVAAGFFIPRKHNEKSYLEQLKDPELTHESKIVLLWYIAQDESERTGYNGESGEYKSRFRDIVASYGIEFSDELIK